MSSPLCRQLIVASHHHAFFRLLRYFDATTILIGWIEVVEVLFVLVLTHHRPGLAALHLLRHLNPGVSNLGDLQVLSEVRMLLIVVQGCIVETTLLADLACVLRPEFVYVSCESRTSVPNLAQIFS